MRTTLLVAAVIAALVVPVVTYREPPTPRATRLDAPTDDIDPIIDMVALGCSPTLQEIEDGVTLVRLCPQPRFPSTDPMSVRWIDP
jgi:hypothetical protein